MTAARSSSPRGRPEPANRPPLFLLSQPPSGGGRRSRRRRRTALVASVLVVALGVGLGCAWQFAGEGARAASPVVAAPACPTGR